MKPNIKIYGDGANIEEMVNLTVSGTVDGLTTNPTLMAKAGITDYLSFAKDVLKKITSTPVSFEVFSDEIDDWVIDELKRIGLDTAKAVLNLEKSDLVKRSDLEEETVEAVRKTLLKEFE